MRGAVLARKVFDFTNTINFFVNIRDVMTSRFTLFKKD
jgi:hypothetical protein